MSLHIGKLSHRTRRVDLEHAFARFGQCKVQMKDGFGFVDYDFPPNAEKALRAFEGKTICGERLTISWSNNQPREFPRFARGGGGSYGAQRGRNLARGGGYGRREDKMNINQLDNNGRRVSSADKENGSREKHRDFRESLPDEWGCVEPAPVDYGRWGDQVRDLSNDHKYENKVDFERYEPYHGYEKKNGYENSLKAGSSPSPGSPQKKIERVQVGERTLGHSNDSKVKAHCYNCGDIGHKKFNCPNGNSLHRKFSRFDRGQNSEMIKEGRGEGNRERYEPKKVKSSEDTSMKPHRKDGEAYGARKPEILSKIGSPPTREKNDSVWRKDYKGKKRSGNEIRISKEHSSKRARRSVSSPLQSDHTASRSHSVSQSTKSERRNSSSRSRSASHRGRSLSSNSRLSSKSHRSRSTSPKSRSRDRFCPSLSPSVGPSSPSPPNETQFSLKGPLGNATAESGKISITKGELGEGNVGSHSANVNGKVVPMEGENSLSSFNTEDDLRKEKGILGSHSANMNCTAVSANDEKALPSSDTEDDIRKEKPLQRMSGSPLEMANPCTPHLDKGVLSNGSLSSSSLETGELPLSGTLAKEDRLTPSEKPDSGAPLSSRACSLTSISAEELNKVLKHYGLALPEQDEKHLSAEDYFGSSRLWPWEIIYYRRLKKGRISNENYAKRLAQNREFGIMDKYIRSSSGWGEQYQDSTV